MVPTPLFVDSLTVMAVTAMVLLGGFLLRFRGEPVANAFVFSALSLTVYSVVMLLPGTFGLPAGSAVPGWPLIELLQFAAGGTATVLFYIYVRLYTGHSQYGNRRKVASHLVPVGAALAVLILLPLARGSLPEIAIAVTPVVAVALYAYVTALLLLGLYLLARLAQRYDEMSPGHVASVCLGMGAPYVAIVASSLTEPTESGGTVSVLPVDVSFVGFLVTGVAFAYAVRTYPLFRPLPGSEYIARDEVIENLADGILILDRDERIIDTNETAADICRDASETVIGRRLPAVFDDLSRVPTESVRRITVQTPDGPRQFEVTTTPIQKGERRLAGKTVRLRDITEQQTREQQLEVLTRVLRHNLRNDIDTALAYTNEIEDSATRAQLRSTLQGLLEMSDKARDVEDVLSKANESPSVVELTEVVSAVVGRVDDDCQIDVSTPESVSVFAHRELLERLLFELVENGIEHNDSPAPAVEIDVTTADDTVEIRVRDNGSGIPDHESSVIESGAETKLHHGTGLGLWLANWIAESLGGELLFPDEASGGAVVVCLYSALVERTEPASTAASDSSTISSDSLPDEQSVTSPSK